MNKLTTYLIIFTAFLFTACSEDDESVTPDTSTTTDNGIPVVKTDSSYTILKEEEIIYAEGLGHSNSSTTPISVPLKLDLYYPDNNSTNRPVFMFIHGGGFKGGTKTKPEIIEMANYYASRGWVFASIDYRTAEELGVSLEKFSQDQVLAYYKGIAPKEWIENTFGQVEDTEQVQQAIAMYLAQRDSKAALRWIIANAETYKINKDYVTVGGASAGAITTIALGISNIEDFRDEMTVDEDSTLSTTNLNETYKVKSMVYFWGSNQKLDVFESIYEVNRYDSNDPELFMAHGDQPDPVTPYEEALELQGIYDSLGIHNELVTLEGFGHGAWNAKVNDKNLFELSFDFLTDRQKLIVE
ncbi:MAG: carboxylesterase family protein [Cytophagales bacterium]|nr:carboxylesterase family protein [Cytophagales bacterium]